MTSVRGELLKAIEASGPLRAIVVCKYTVPEIASAGVAQVRRARHARQPDAAQPVAGLGRRLGAEGADGLRRARRQGREGRGAWSTAEVVTEPSRQVPALHARAADAARLHALPRPGRPDLRVDPQPARARLPATTAPPAWRWARCAAR
ncbi:MAG: hypothetical protein MZV63_26870 [Marinilabiliales bacterium]|nr:hypothetical protein [Marinilabiliales bacterium]